MGNAAPQSLGICLTSNIFYYSHPDRGRSLALMFKGRWQVKFYDRLGGDNYYNGQEWCQIKNNYKTKINEEIKITPSLD